MDPLVLKYSQHIQSIFERYAANVQEMDTYENLYFLLTNRRARVKATTDSLNAMHITHKIFFIFMKVLQGPLDIDSHDVSTIYDHVIELVLRILSQFKTRQEFLEYTQQRPMSESPPGYSPPAYASQFHIRSGIAPPAYESGVYDILAWYVRNFGPSYEAADIGIETFYKNIVADDITDHEDFLELHEILEPFQEDMRYYDHDTLAFIDTNPRFATPWFILIKSMGNMTEHVRFTINMRRVVFRYLFAEPFPDEDGVFYTYTRENTELADLESFWLTVPDDGYDALDNAVSKMWNHVDAHIKILEM